MKRGLRHVAWLLAYAAGLLTLPSCAGPPTPIAFEGQGKPLVLRCSMRPSERYLYPSNYLAYPSTVQAGSEAIVTMFSPTRIDFTLNKVSYQMIPLTQTFKPAPDEYLKRYLVNSVDEIGLSNEPARKHNILAGMWSIGMTKQEVYAAVGPPMWVDFDMDATNMTYQEIMDKNRWVYRMSDIMATWWPVQKAFNFDPKGVLASTVPP